MKRNLLLTIALMLLATFGMSGQVKNYSIDLSTDGYVNCGIMPELDGATSYTVQFWINPDVWTSGASIYSRGSDFKAMLGTEGNVTFTVGETSLGVSSDALVAGAWSQITLLCDNGEAKIFVNQNQLSTGTLAAIPVSESAFVIGGGYDGRIDEVRLWNAALSSDYNYFFNNTLNKWNPQWDNLVAYYKMDQELCPNLVDYKTLLAEEGAINHHGIFSDSGVTRALAADNTELPYLLNGAYTANERFYDRAIPREQYLLSNDLIILGIEMLEDGHLRYKTPCNHGTITNGTYLEEFEGREGVISFDGTGKITAPSRTLEYELNSSGVATGYAFETWLYIDEWVEGAYIFRKEVETADGGINGFSISLGAESNKQVVVKVNGNKYVNVNKMPVGQWVHFAVIPSNNSATRTTFLFSFNGSGYYASANQSDGSTDYTPVGIDDCEAVIGENFKGKLDETAIWGRVFSTDDFKNHMTNLPKMKLGGLLTADVMKKANTLYLYDDPTRLGWSSYSQDEWRDIQVSAYEGYRGYQVRISVSGHSNWTSIITNATYRTNFAKDLAELVEGYDGAELDLEWLHNNSSYGLLVDEIKEYMPEGKTFMVSCHAYGAYSIPANRISKCDGFTLQQYGPSNTFFYWSNFTSSTKNFQNYGVPNNKIYLSYATTTSGGYQGSTKYTSPIGVRNGLLDADGYVPSDDVDVVANGNYDYYFTGPKQTYRRAKYVLDNKMQGIFYWDMGNDVAVEHKYNLAKHCSYGLNANVDSLVTEVTVNHPTAIVDVFADKVQGKNVVIAPNPVENDLNVILSSGEAVKEISIYSIGGACVLKAVPDSCNSVAVGNLATGLYGIIIRTQNGTVYNSKFVKK